MVVSVGSEYMKLFPRLTEMTVESLKIESDKFRKKIDKMRKIMPSTKK